MARGTEDFTVQDLMDFLYSQEQQLRLQNEAAYENIGQAYADDNTVWLEREMKDYRDRSAAVTRLEEFRFEVERKCGELHDRREREVVSK